ncbi:hypothetical protein IWQ60_010540 [Tieghemiomyces parasiticus]|uniref:Queuosine 5'-phosphate N-glycosylase/hydrolase n=1 Tax=Tieghemiomyces parasiticus TaxID=78921 RepID=A0A9W7ZQ71_9FUNG|nr:hypothetical protein IWQ60_010540 [Tieghemiomyces parasiticus]
MLSTDATPTYPELVRQTCKTLVERSADHVQINQAGIDDFLNNLDLSRFRKLSKGWINFPLKFDTPEDEVNLVALVDLLNFGSGFRAELHRATGRGASQTILFGCMGMYIGQVPLSADGMSKAHLADVATYFGIPLLGEEVPHPTIPALTISEPSPLRALAQQITDVLQETGTILKEQGYRSLGHFILEATRKPEHAPANWRPSAAELVRRLVKAFPSFQDYRVVDDQPDVYLLKRAQLLAADLRDRFVGTNSPVAAQFDFSDMAQLTVFADNVLPTVLDHFQILKITDVALVEKLAQKTPVTTDEMWLLRAAAVVGAEQIVARGHQLAAECAGPESPRAAHYTTLAEMLNPVALDHYLWHIGKDESIRKRERLVYKDTVYF